MVDLHPQFITDSDGKRISIILPIQEFESLLDALEDLEDVRLYDEAKKEDTGERILLDDYIKYRSTVL
jgi:hypothetical protein